MKEKILEELKRGRNQNEYLIPDDLKDLEIFKDTIYLCCNSEEKIRLEFNRLRKKYKGK